MEQWKDIKGYERFYQISNLGRLRSLDRFVPKDNSIMFLTGKILKIFRMPSGYVNGTLSKDGIVKSLSIHRAVGIAFIPNPEKKPFINHIDSNKENNVVTNLEWVTPHENNLHSMEYGMTRSMKRKDIPTVIKLYNGGATLKELGIMYNFSGGTIRKVIVRNGGEIRTQSDVRKLQAKKNKVNKIRVDKKILRNWVKLLNKNNSGVVQEQILYMLNE